MNQKVERKRYFGLKTIVLWVLFSGLSAGMLILGPKHTLDARLYYTGSEAYAYLSGLSPAQNRAYFINELFDLVFILTYSALLYLTLQWLFPARPRLRYLAFIPGAFDLVETGTILLCLSGVMDIRMVPGLGKVTFLKWMTGLVLVAVCGVGCSRRKSAGAGSPA